MSGEVDVTFAALRARTLPAWFDDAKLGILVHWGPSSVPAFAPLGPDVFARAERDGWDVAFAENPYSEWYWNSMSIAGSSTAQHHAARWPGRRYEDFAADFAAATEHFDATRWASAFAAAGARYVVLTTKHHDGYLLWPSAHPNPYRAGWQSERDLVGEVTDAVRAAGLRMGLYYSGGIDWTFGGFPIRALPDFFTATPQSDEYAAYADRHWRELIDRYAPSILWNDIGYPRGADYHRLFADYYAAVADGVVNDRFDFIGAVSGTAHHDFRTPEYAQLDEITPYPWECVRGIGSSFGSNQNETDDDMLSAAQIIDLLAGVVSKNGRLLLGVGPTADGTIPAGQAQRLAALGEWMAVNGEAIHGTRPWRVAAGDAATGQPVRYTLGPDALYAIISGAIGTPEIVVRGLSLPAGVAATVLGDGPIAWRRADGGVAFATGRSESPATVIRLHPAP